MPKLSEIDMSSSTGSLSGRIAEPLELMASSLVLLLVGFGFLFLAFCL
jgi:hypothetical protein